MSLAYNKFNSFVENVNEKVFNLGSDTLKVALTNSAPVATNTILANITEISYANLSARTITQSSSAQSSGTYKLILNALTLTATGAVATFRYIVVYDDTATNDELVCWFDRGSTLTMANGDTYIITPDPSNGLFSMT